MNIQDSFAKFKKVDLAMFDRIVNFNMGGGGGGG